MNHRDLMLLMHGCVLCMSKCKGMHLYMYGSKCGFLQAYMCRKSIVAMIQEMICFKWILISGQAGILSSVGLFTLRQTYYMLTSLQGVDVR